VTKKTTGIERFAALALEVPNLFASRDLQAQPKWIKSEAYLVGTKPASLFNPFCQLAPTGRHYIMHICHLV
jgi:hypothetical protein